MQKLIAKYGLAAHLAILAVAPLFLSATCVLWLAALALVWLTMGPSCIGGEHLHEARDRVLDSVLRDPFFWFAVVLVCYTAARFLNNGVELAYDAESAKWAISEPTVSILPFAGKDKGECEFISSIALTLVVLGCRHALGKSARMSFLLLSSALAGLGAVLAAYSLHGGDAELLRESSCALTNPAYKGTFYGIYLVVGVVALLGVHESGWLKAMPLTVFSVGGNLVGLFLFAPALVQLVLGAVAFVMFFYSFAYARRKLGGTAEFRYLVTFVIPVVLGGVLAVLALPDAAFKLKIQPFEECAFIPKGFLDVRAALSAVSLKSWMSAPWLGHGLGDFPLALRFNALPSDWSVIGMAQSAPLNGYWLLLTEGGIVEAVFVACALGFLLWTYGARLAKGLTARFPHPSCWLGPLVLVAVLAEALVDVSYTVPGVMIAVASLLALSACAFPKGED